tara:strand:+ start:302 stop:469 length:168 start_codon:yes stop_codon:yes gene_type:complete
MPKLAEPSIERPLPRVSLVLSFCKNKNRWKKVPKKRKGIYKTRLDKKIIFNGKVS